MDVLVEDYVLVENQDYSFRVRNRILEKGGSNLALLFYNS